MVAMAVTGHAASVFYESQRTAHRAARKENHIVGKEETGVIEFAFGRRDSVIRERFVGREQELADLWERLLVALEGQGQVCLIQGQAGSGKTALVLHFAQRALALQSDMAVGIGSGNAQTGIGDPYLPFREALLMLTGAAKRGKSGGLADPQEPGTVRAALARTTQILVEVAPDLVGLFVPGASLAGAVGKAMADKLGWMDKLDEVAKPDKPPPEQSRIFEQYTAFVQKLSERTPLFLFIDDLQWADNASLALFFHLARSIRQHRVILVGAFRPSDVALGRGGSRHPLVPIINELTRYYGYVLIDLDHIPDLVTRHFVDALVDAEPNQLDAGFRQALYEHTQGHALFTVELLQHMQERGDLVRDEAGRWVTDGDVDWTDLPARVEGVIEERIGRLDDELKEMLTVASVQGESFTAEVVARVQEMAERAAVRQLSRALTQEHRLVSPQGVVKIGRLRLSLYRFLHNLFQQYLYGNLTQAERIYLHRDVGEVLEALFEGQTDQVAAQLARHFEEAGFNDKAATYHLQAATRALEMSAHQEATVHTDQGLALVADLPPGREKQALELGLRITEGVALVGTRGYAAPEVELAFGRAGELAQALDDPAHRIPALYGLAGVYFVRAEFQKTLETSTELVALAQKHGQTGYELGGRLILASSNMYRGQLDRARQGLEETVSRYDPIAHRQLGHQLSQDPAVGALSFLSWVQWQTGYPDRAVRTSEKALTLARSLDHPYSLGFAITFAAILQQLRQECETCESWATQAIQLGRERQYPTWLAMGSMAKGWALAQKGAIPEGLAMLTEGLSLWTATGARLALEYFHTLLAEIHLAAGDREAGLETLNEHDHALEEIWWLPEQHHVRAELLLLDPTAEAEAEAELRQGLELAQRSGARTLALRSSVALARLLDDQGHGAAARALLADQLSGFTEGFDTQDLLEAKSLLSELAAKGT